ncbi:MAG: ATPase [Candidatus Micrarchaeia archaeon]
MATELVNVVDYGWALGLTAIGAGISMGLGAIATGNAQSAIGSSAVGAIAERPELAGNMLIYVALPETTAILALAISAMLIVMIGQPLAGSIVGGH